MKKERKVTQPKEIVVFDKNVRVSKLNTLIKKLRGDVIINGDLIIDEHLQARCNLHVMENIVCESDPTIEIEGNLYCYGNVDCFDIIVNGCFYSEGVIDAADITVQENLWCKDKIEAYGAHITVAGDLECYGIEAEEVEVLGKMSICGAISIDYLIRTGY